MTYLFINTGTYTLGKSFVVEGSGNGIMVSSVCIDHLVYICSGYPRLDMLSHKVQHTCINFPTLTYSFYLGLCFYQTTCGHQMPFLLNRHNLPVHFGSIFSFGQCPAYLVLDNHSNWFFYLMVHFLLVSQRTKSKSPTCGT